LKILNLENENFISNEGIQYFIDVVNNKMTLKILNLENENFISNEGIQYFIDVVNNKMV